MTDKTRLERRGIGGPSVEVPDYPRLKLVMTGHGLGELYVDGVKVAKVKGVDICVKAGELNTALVELQPETIEIEGDFNISRWRSATTVMWEKSSPLRKAWKWIKLRALSAWISIGSAIKDARG